MLCSRVWRKQCHSKKLLLCTCPPGLLVGLFMMHADVGCVGQVVDFWAFSTEQWGKEIMSMHHTRNALQKSTPQVIFPCQRALPIGAHMIA